MCVKTVLLVPFPVPKLLPKHEFIHMVRTMNSETHQYVTKEDYILDDMYGYLSGEFRINGG